jgi:hypothetical protein
MNFNPKLLECTFLRRLESREGDDGRTFVLRPRLGEGVWGRKICAFLNLSDYRIRLDDIGTFVWDYCDGKTSGKRLAELLRQEFGETIEPAEERLGQFILQMQRARMIEIISDSG